MKQKLEIETERLILGQLLKEHSVMFFCYRSDKITNKFQGWIPEIIEDAQMFIEKLPDKIDLHESWYQLAIIKKESNNLIGDIGLHFIGDENEQVEIGFTLAKNEQGKGYAFEAVYSILDYLFFTLGKHRVIGSVDPQNISSIKLLEKLRFRKEAHFKKSICINGQWVDDVIYGLLNEEWRKENITL